MNLKFGTDGIRGPVESVITPEACLKIGHATGLVMKELGWKTVVIGKDTRLSGYMLESALQAGFIAAGVNVRLLGPLPTPGVAYLTKTLRNKFGVVISASHNDFLDNGIKIFNEDGEKISRNIEKRIEKYLSSELIPVETSAIGKAYRFDESGPRYIEFCKSTVPSDISFASLRIVLDCANGACYKVSPEIFEELGAEVITIGNEPDGYNINQNCGSTFIKGLPKIVSEDKSLFGLSMDGDGDRIVIVDNNGNILDGDDILYTIVYGKLLNKEKVSGVVGTKMTNLSLEKFLNSKNIKFVRTDVGDKYVLEKMIKNNFIIGGETSGHILMLDKISSGDSIIAALAFLNYYNILKENGINHKLNKYPQTLKNIKIDKTLQENFVNVVINEAIKKYSDNNARLIIRKSGTENCIRVMVEAENILTVESLSTEVSNFISEKLK